MKQKTEVTENKLKKILDNTRYRLLKTFDFQHYDVMLRFLKRKLFKTDKEFLEYKKSMLKGVSSGKYDAPQILVSACGKVECTDGEVRLLTAKVLGLDPVVEITYEKEPCYKVKDQRLVISY